MPRPATGSIRTKSLGDGRTAYHLRYSIRGRRHEELLGHSPEMTPAEAEVRRRQIMADVQRGYHQAGSGAEGASVAPTLHEYGSLWLANLPAGTPATTRSVYAAEVRHVAGVLGNVRLDEITGRDLAELRDRKIADGKSLSYVNKMITRVGNLLDRAMADGVIADQYNPARNKALRLRGPSAQARKGREWLSCDQVECLLEAAKALESQARADRAGLGRPEIVATLVFAGLRATELCQLNVADYNGAILCVTGSKTDAGVRNVNVVPALAPYLERQARRRSGATGQEPLFPTARGTRRNKDNLRRNIWLPVAGEARSLAAARIADGARLAPIPENLKPHDARRTFATMLAQAGRTPGYVQNQLGHQNAALALDIYTHTTHLAERAIDPRIGAWMVPPKAEAAPESSS